MRTRLIPVLCAFVSRETLDIYSMKSERKLHRERVELLPSLSLIFCHSARGVPEASGEEAGRLSLGELSKHNDLAPLGASSLNHTQSEGSCEPPPPAHGLS